MRALVGSPGSPGNVEFREVEPPQPAPDEAVIAVKAFAMNRGELSLLAARPAGWRPGQDIAGVVVRAAADGTGPKEGTRVVALTDFGGWSEQAAAKTARCAELPDAVTFEDAASLPVAGLTALRALRVGGSLLGKRVLITGASGGVGSFAMQLARDAGATATGVSSAADAPDAQFDVILESVGGASLAGSLHRVAAEGVVVMYGNSSKEPTTIPGFPDFGGRPHAKLYAFFIYSSGERPSFGEDLGLLARLIAEGRLKPQVGATFAWTEFARAFDGLAARKIPGKAVLRIE
jgi:NADPH:quinone reductase-like Zn-dependent oxidoreductase